MLEESIVSELTQEGSALFIAGIAQHNDINFTAAKFDTIFENTRAPRTEEELQAYEEFEAHRAYLHARHVIQGRFPEGEDSIAKDAWFSYMYAKNVLNGRFRMGEDAILGHHRYARMYSELIATLNIASVTGDGG